MEEDNASMSIYKPELVIDRIEVSGSTSRVTCIECCGSRLFIGTAEGFLIEYFITDEEGNVLFRKIRHADLHNKNQSVQYMRAASAIDSLLILSGNQLGLFGIHSLELKGTSSIKNVYAIGVDENPISGDPFAVQFCLSRKASIQLGEATEKGLTLAGRELSLDSVPLALSMESGLVCAALANGYYTIINTGITSSKPITLCSFDTRDKPQAIHVGKEEFLVLGPGGLGVFVTKDGSSQRPPISWPQKVSQIAVHNHMNILGMGQDVIYVHSLVDYERCEKIPFQGLLKCLCVCEGNLYVSSSKSLFKLNPISIEEQVDTLLLAEEYGKALTLLQLSHLKFKEHQILESKIHRRAAFAHLANLDFDFALESIRTSDLDLREIVSLFPKMLPSSSTFKRTLPPLHKFVDIRHMTKGDEEREREIGAFLAATLSTVESYASQELSTALFKFVALYESREALQTLLTSVNVLPLDFPDLLGWLDSQKFYTTIGMIYIKIGELGKAIDIWISALEGRIQPSQYDTFPGISLIIESLVDSRDSSLVWTYFEKLLPIDASAAVEIFSRKPISSDYPPLRVAEKLGKWPDISILYLEDCVEKRELEDEDCHTYLASLYIDQILALDEGKEKERSDWRSKLRNFFIQSNFLRLQFLIGRLTNTLLRHELAILHGKAGDHKPALLLFTTELNDHKLARDYCRNLKRKEERKEAFLILLEIYFHSEQGKEIQERMENTLKVLGDFGEEFDLSLVLWMLPDDWSIAFISGLLFRGVRNTIHKKRQAQLLGGLSKRMNIDWQMGSFQGNQGYVIDAESICTVCHKVFDLTDPIFTKQGFVVHDKCK